MNAAETSSLKGKRVAIFGGTSGLGLALAERMARDGADVVVISRRQKHLDTPLRQMNHCDVSDAASVSRTFELIDKHGEPDIVINAAGVGLRRPTSQITPNEVDTLIGTDLVGVINTSREAAKRMERRGKGIIVNIGSTTGTKPRANETVYAAAKWGVTGFTRSLKLELNPKGIAVVLANPGGMDTSFWEKADSTQDRSGFMDAKSVADKIADYISQPNLLQTDQEILIERQK